MGRCIALTWKQKNKLFILLIFSIGLVLLFTNLNQKDKHLANYQKTEFYYNFLNLSRKDKSDKLKVKAIIVPHHLFAHSLIENLFFQTKSKKIKRVILISPNHFNRGRSLIITSKAVWQTNFGKVYPALDLIEKLTEDEYISIEEEPFKKEHGIYNLVPYIKIAFPRAKIIPIILKPRVNQVVALKLVQKLNQISNENTLIIASLDFSHFQMPQVAQEHDKESIRAIEHFDLESVWKLDVDSPPTLYAFLSYLKNNGYTKFTLVENTNSGWLSGNPNLKETTSYITGYFQ